MLNNLKQQEHEFSVKMQNKNLIKTWICQFIIDSLMNMQLERKKLGKKLTNQKQRIERQREKNDIGDPF